MTSEARRRRDTELHQQYRREAWIERAFGKKVCPDQLTHRLPCGGILTRRVENGRIVPVCERHERKARGICVECGKRPVFGKPGRGIHCIGCSEKAHRERSERCRGTRHGTSIDNRTREKMVKAFQRGRGTAWVAERYGVSSTTAWRVRVNAGLSLTQRASHKAPPLEDFVWFQYLDRGNAIRDENERRAYFLRFSKHGNRIAPAAEMQQEMQQQGAA